MQPAGEHVWFFLKENGLPNALVKQKERPPQAALHTRDLFYLTVELDCHKNKGLLEEQ